MLLIFGGAGTIRSLRKELGTTTTLLVCLIVLSRWGDKILRGIDLPLGLVADVSIFQGRYSPLIQSSIYEGILLGTAFLSYRFDILAFRWPDMGGLLGALLGLLVGLVNGYLIVGGIWYYLDKFDYPLRLVGLFQGQLTYRAAEMLPYLPPTFLGSYLALLAGGLVVLRLVKW
jgi:hypothetical protein